MLDSYLNDCLLAEDLMFVLMDIYGIDKEEMKTAGERSKSAMCRLLSLKAKQDDIVTSEETAALKKRFWCGI